MLNLDDPKWQTFEGGYRTPYDASVLLRQFENTSDPEIINSILNELWEELHHQGDVGLASYMSVPHLIRISKEKHLFDTDLLGLVTVIEIQRQKNNPDVPKEYEEEYFNALKQITELTSLGFNKDWDLETASCILSAIAIAKNQTQLGKAILNMDSGDIIEDFVKDY
jgi:hypothetical protein